MNNGKICVSVCASTSEEMLALVHLAEKNADIIELRFDCLAANELASTPAQIAASRPLIATLRSPDQGGKNKVTLDERLQFWKAFRAGYWAVDLEEDIFEESTSSGLRILSLHDHKGVPSDIGAAFRRMSASGADVVKVAVTARDIVDAVPVWSLLGMGIPCVPIAMGEAGQWTRILGLAHGAFMTYAAPGCGRETAVGQLTADELVNIYRVKELDTATKVYGVIGDPVSGSRSPHLHNPAFAAAGLNSVFLPLQVKDIDAFIGRMVRSGTREVELNFAGFSVTMPHKQAIIPHLDAIDPVAETIGAVNTVRIDNEKLTGFNTDAAGFIAPLEDRLGDIAGARVALAGAGGAARACVYGLREAKANVTVITRDPSKGARLAGEFGVSASGGKNWTSGDFDILVNATPLGMKGQLEERTLFTAEELSGLKLVYDLVTSDSDTPLIAAAHRAGISTIGGMEMLIAQAELQFEIWTGMKPEDGLMTAAASRLKVNDEQGSK